MRIPQQVRSMFVPPVVRKVRRRKLTYLDDTALIWLRKQVRLVEAHQVPGEIIEAGCAKGGSSIVIAKAKATDRRLSIYDTFGLIPPPSDRDGRDVHERYAVISSGKSAGIDGDRYYGYETDLLEKVRSEFERFGVPAEKHNVRFIQGLYEKTLHLWAPVALAHIDCDWYDSVMVCLERIEPLLSTGGRLVIDDYHAYSGCRDAVNDYFRERMSRYRFMEGPRLVIERTTRDFSDQCAIPRPSY